MVDVRKREDGLLDELRVLYSRRDMAFLQLELNQYAYPELGAVWDALRACLKGADE